MQLSSTLSWLVDAAADSAGADRFLAKLGAHLLSDGLPLAGGALTLDIPHPLIARRTWLWRADNGEVIRGFGVHAWRAVGSPGSKPGRRCRPALARINRFRPRARGPYWATAQWPSADLDRPASVHAERDQ